MIKSGLIAQLAQKYTDLSEKDVSHAAQLIIDEMTESLSSNGRIEVRGFGSFSLHHRPPRNAHNPRTGEKVLTTSKYTPHFKPGKELREQVDASKHLPIQESAEE